MNSVGAYGPGDSAAIPLGRLHGGGEDRNEFVGFGQQWLHLRPGHDSAADECSVTETSDTSTPACRTRCGYYKGLYSGDRGRERGLNSSPPSEPDRRISRIRLSR